MTFWHRVNFFGPLLSARNLSLAALLSLVIAGGCKSTVVVLPGQVEGRKGDEIVVAGVFVHTGTPVVLWMDPGGYDAYRVERRFGPYDKSSWSNSIVEERSLRRSPARYRMRRDDLTPEELERVRGGGWDLPLLQRSVDQFVIHFDVAGISRTCFKTLQDSRDLSVHFMLDIDGTIYQTLDLKECAQHATISNDRSIGIEIANLGSYHPTNTTLLDKWYKRANGQTTIVIPGGDDGGVRTKGFVGHPRHPNLIKGNIQGEDLVQYDFTPQQYAALIKLTAAVCTVLPKIQCRYPTDADGKLITRKLSDADLQKYEGVLGHYHIQTDKVDPGPAFDWDYVIGNARKLMGQKAEPVKEEHKDLMVVP